MVADIIGQIALMCMAVRIDRGHRLWIDRGQGREGRCNSCTNLLPWLRPDTIVLVSPVGPSKRNRRGWSASHLGAGAAVQPGCFVSEGSCQARDPGVLPGVTHKVARRRCYLRVRPTKEWPTYSRKECTMVTLTCLWCDEEEVLSFAALEEPDYHVHLSRLRHLGAPRGRPVGRLGSGRLTRRPLRPASETWPGRPP